MSGVEELLDERAERVGLGEARDLVAELEVLEDVLHVRREAVEVGLEVGLELLLAGAGLEVAQRELRGVVEGLAGGLAQGWSWLDDAGLVERGLHVEHGLLGRLEHRVEPPQHGHRQDHVAVLAAHIEVAEHVVRDAPDEVGDPVQVAVAHASGPWFREGGVWGYNRIKKVKGEGILNSEVSMNAEGRRLDRLPLSA